MRENQVVPTIRGFVKLTRKGSLDERFARLTDAELQAVARATTSVLLWSRRLALAGIALVLFGVKAH